MQAVRGQGEEAVGGGAAGDVFDIGVEATVFVDDEDGWEGPLPGWLDQVAAHLAGVAAGGVVGDVGGFDAGVGEGDGLGAGVIGDQGLGHGEAAGDGGALGEEAAAVHAAVAVFVVEVEDALVDFELGDGGRGGGELVGLGGSPMGFGRA